MPNYTGGVWRTIRGTHVFIRDGEDLETAFKRVKQKGYSDNDFRKQEERIAQLRNEYRDLETRVGEYDDDEFMSGSPAHDESKWDLQDKEDELREAREKYEEMSKSPYVERKLKLGRENYDKLMGKEIEEKGYNIKDNQITKIAPYDDTDYAWGRKNEKGTWDVIYKDNQNLQHKIEVSDKETALSNIKDINSYINKKGDSVTSYEGTHRTYIPNDINKYAKSITERTRRIEDGKEIYDTFRQMGDKEMNAFSKKNPDAIAKMQEYIKNKHYEDLHSNHDSSDYDADKVAKYNKEKERLFGKYDGDKINQPAGEQYNRIESNVKEEYLQYMREHPIAKTDIDTYTKNRDWYKEHYKPKYKNLDEVIADRDSKLNRYINSKTPLEKMTRQQLAEYIVDDQISRGIVKEENRTMQVQGRLKGIGAAKAMSKNELYKGAKDIQLSKMSLSELRNMASDYGIETKGLSQKQLVAKLIAMFNK